MLKKLAGPKFLYVLIKKTTKSPAKAGDKYLKFFNLLVSWDEMHNFKNRTLLQIFSQLHNNFHTKIKDLPPLQKSFSQSVFLIDFLISDFMGYFANKFKNFRKTVKI